MSDSAAMTATPVRHARLHPVAAVGLAAERCLALQKPWSGCDTCAAICPAGCLTISPDGAALDGPRCTGCGRCAEACPTLALAVDGLNLPVPAAVPMRLSCLRAATGSAHRVSCLLGLGVRGLLQAIADAGQVTVVDPGQCTRCADAGGKGISDLLADVTGVLEANGIDPSCVAVEPDSESVTLPSGNQTDSAAVPVPGRRAFFSGFGRAATRSVQRHFGAAPVAPVAAEHYRTPPLPARRNALLAALLMRLGSRAAGAVPRLPLPQVRVSGRCDGHGVCARVCPSGALTARAVETEHLLSFDAMACTACGACVAHCPSRALTLSAPDLAAGRSASETLRRAVRRTCRECGEPTALESDLGLCHTCSRRGTLAHAGFGLGMLRRQHPETGPPSG